MTRPAAPRGLRAALVAARTTTAGAPRGRRRLGLMLLVGIPVLVQTLGLIFGDSGRGEGFQVFADIVTEAYLLLITPLTMIFLGTAAFGDEWAGGTAHYVVGLPISRGTLVAGRWLASARRGIYFLLPPITACFVLCLIGFEGGIMHYLADLGLVLLVVSYLALAYGAIFMFFGLALKRAVMISLIYVFLFELLTANLPQTFASLSLGFHGRNILWQLTGNDRFQLDTLNVFEVAPMSVTWSVFWIAGVGLLATLLSSVMLRRKECGGEIAASDAAAT